jgi:hypothetical protein
MRFFIAAGCVALSIALGAKALGSGNSYALLVAIAFSFIGGWMGARK